MGKKAKDARRSKGYAMPKCGDDFVRPIPTGFGRGSDDTDTEVSDKNHWKIVFDAHREEDENECEHWKDEVNNLIIFAGLFSAIVTAFLIESYKFLLPDGSPDPGKFGLDHGHAVRLNSLWFCSLVLSLSMVVIGIVALQWLRDHQRYHNIKPRDALSVFEMRRKALKAWNIRGAFLSLPILILVALVLFFVGLVDFLLTLNKAVAAPVGVLVYATLTILFVTTVLPSCQIFWIFVSNRSVESNEDVPIPCPYKSPQSLLLLRFFGFIVRRLQDGMVHKSPTDETTGPVNVDVSRRRMPLYLIFYEALDNWSHYDTRWLRLRDVYSQTMGANKQYPQTPASNNQYSQTIGSDNQPKDSYSSRYFLHPRRPIFDEAQILRWTLSDLNTSANVLFAAYHCFREVSKNALYDRVDSSADYFDPQRGERNKILRGYYWGHLTLKSPPYAFGWPPVSQLVDAHTSDLLQDENMLVYLQMHNSHNLPDDASRIISAHLCELQARILAYAYTAEPPIYFQPPAVLTQEQDAPEQDLTFQWPLVILQQYIEMIESTIGPPKFKVPARFASSSLTGNEVSVSHETIQMAIIQFSHIFECLVQRIDQPQLSLPWVEGNVIYAHKGVVRFWKVPAAMLRYRGTNQRPFNPFSQFEQGFERLRAALNATSKFSSDTAEVSGDMAEQTNVDYLFLATCAMVNELFSPYTLKLPLHPFEPQQVSRMASLIEALDFYERKDKALRRIRDNYSRLWSTTGLPAEPYDFDTSYDEGGNAHIGHSPSYIRWDYIPTWMKISDRIPPPSG